MRDLLRYINHNDSKQDGFAHQTAIKKNKPSKFLHSLGDGKTVEFYVVEDERRVEAANVTDSRNRAVVRGSKP